jgi:hypothetical protein
MNAVDAIIAIFIKLQERLITLYQARVELEILLDEYAKELNDLIKEKT